MKGRGSIGDFARMTHLSVKSLRHYHEVGLPAQARIDPRLRVPLPRLRTDKATFRPTWRTLGSVVVALRRDHQRSPYWRIEALGAL
jgi:MerR family regulatory protein